jgi:hypothetical protein
VNYRYALFIFDQYYPQGGWEDYVDTYADLEVALETAANAKCDFWHIVDLEIKQIVRKGSRK